VVFSTNQTAVALAIKGTRDIIFRSFRTFLGVPMI
jgi:hypothetical protein